MKQKIMIDPKLLRIGNTLQYANDNRLKEDRIGKRFHITIDDLMFFHKNCVDYVTYAPLTKEILVQNGFTYNDLQFEKNGVILVFDTQKELFLFYSGEHKTELKFIHQLENLYFAILGVELEILL